MRGNVIGGADGPTVIFVGEKIEASWINIFGLIIVILMLLPNLLYVIKFHGIENKCKNKAMNLLEQIGRYTSMFLMIFNIGVVELGFSSVKECFIYFVGNTMLIIIYYIVWILYFKRTNFLKSMLLAIIPPTIFLLSGITLRHYLLVISAIIFGVGHIYVTYKNAK